MCYIKRWVLMQLITAFKVKLSKTPNTHKTKDVTFSIYCTNLWNTIITLFEPPMEILRKRKGSTRLHSDSLAVYIRWCVRDLSKQWRETTVNGNRKEGEADKVTHVLSDNLLFYEICYLNAEFNQLFRWNEQPSRLFHFYLRVSQLNWPWTGHSIRLSW